MMNVFLFCFVFLGGISELIKDTRSRPFPGKRQKKKKCPTGKSRHTKEKEFGCLFLFPFESFQMVVMVSHSSTLFFFYYYFCVKQLPTTKPPSPPITPICWTGVVLRIVQHVWKKKKNRVRLFLANVSVHTDTYVMTHFPRKRFFLFSFSSLGDAVFSLHLN